MHGVLIQAARLEDCEGVIAAGYGQDGEGWRCATAGDRRADVVGLKVQNDGFVGITELLWLVVAGGGKVAEIPAVLTSRRLGYSKLRTLPVMRGHLRLISRIAISKLTGKP